MSTSAVDFTSLHSRQCLELIFHIAISAMPLIIVSENIPTLPSNCVVRYLDEGAANIVYRISIPPPSPSSSILEEHGDGTPPPSIIESADDQQSSDIDFMIFDGRFSFVYFTSIWYIEF